MTYTIDTTIPSSVKTDDNKMFVSVDGPYRVKDVKIHGKSIDLKKTYTVASHNYMLKDAGDGLNMFQKDKMIKDSIMLDNQVLINYITENLKGTVPTAYAKAQGRISIIREPFADVAESDWYYSGVLYAYENGLFSGKTATSFAPYATMTRGQLATVLWRMAGSPEPKASAAFTDVAADSYYAKAIAWAAENGITSGTSAAAFSPNAPITRQQFATFLFRFYTLDGKNIAGVMGLAGYEDVTAIAPYATEAMNWAASRGLIQGSNGKINPAGTAYRCQVAVILQRYCQSAAAAEK